MRKFYSPVPAASQIGMFRDIKDYDTCGFDITAFWRGERFEGQIPACVRLWVSDGDAADFMFAPVSWYVYSDRAADLILRRAAKDVQFFPAPLYHLATKERIQGYRILNATRRLPCIDMKRSSVRYDQNTERITSVTPLILDQQKIPDHVHVFRPMEFPFALYFSGELVHDFDGLGMRDFGFIESDD